MFSQTYYLLRSNKDGQYLVARPRSGEKNEASYLLLYKEHYDALSYLNKHGAQVANRFGVESISGTQVKGLLERWGFEGVGIVEDPLIPQIQFLSAI
ncbi:hypothetical protein IQ249_18635 [Lusitaniella coriacea LEGE 07157]|uniref:Uncharacterized protein n=1 Tax=Lusitaniella coriacea LEGE 07157 TaxID=945747 RepID=A0A8J7E0C6_9CYAN|nr:hypothetical protein [Lusitaniella coriacea]MBE9117918.1 hypothetical protein [Lusitaniella coriacea LEGE 07157]